MKARTIAVAIGAYLVLSTLYSVVAEIYFDHCGLSEAQATDMVAKELDRLGLDKKHLSGPESQEGSCSYSFDFEGQGRKLNYVVMSTWLQGVKLNVWDFKRDEEYARSKSQQKP
jgi:hypothetical protein